MTGVNNLQLMGAGEDILLGGGTGGTLVVNRTTYQFGIQRESGYTDLNAMYGSASPASPTPMASGDSALIGGATTDIPASIFGG